MGVTQNARDAPLSIAPEDPHHGEARSADETLLSVDAVPFVKEMVADLHRPPAGYRIHVQRRLDQNAALAPICGVRELLAAILELRDEVLGLSNVEPTLIMVEFNIIGDH